MSALAGTLGERVTLLARNGRDTLGGGGDWSEGLTLWPRSVPTERAAAMTQALHGAGR